MQVYACEWPDCDKTYKKAADLERHERTREHDDHIPRTFTIDSSVELPSRPRLTMSLSHPLPSLPHGKKGKARAPGEHLRRGDACLMCRAKKLKCSAKKPVCDECAKRDDRRVYDAVRPASRVEKLEKKLAEMEDAALREALASRHFADAVGKVNGPSNLQMPRSIPAIDFSIHFPFQQPQPPPAAPAPADPTQLWSLALDPSAVPDLSFNAAAVQPGQMPCSLLSLSEDMSMWDTWMVDQAQPGISTNSNAGTGAGSGFDVNALDLDVDPLLPDPFANIAPSAMVTAPLTTSGPEPTTESVTVDEVISPASNLSALQLEEKDISQSIQDYLLDLFFATPRETFGSEAFTETQFRAKLALSPRQRPHSCLLFAMYTASASSAYIPLVRALADSLYAIAVVKLEEAIRQEDRLLDAINAARMLGKWLYSRSRPLEGYQLGWKAASLALACQLHKIHSDVFSNYVAASNDNPWPLLGPPKDQWDLGERIHTFWGAWGIDRGACLLVPWPSGLSDDVVTTPLPLAPERYSDGTATLFPDMTIPDLYTSPEKLRTLEKRFTFLILALHLVHRAQDLRHRLPDAHPVFSYKESKDAGSGVSPAFCPRRDHPMAYAEMMSGVKNLLANLPDSCSINMLESPPWCHPDVPMIHVMMLSCRMMLHDLEGEAIDRDICLSSAREIAGLAKLWIRQMKIDELKDQCNPKLTNRHKNGLAGPYVLNPWYWTADRLVRGAKLLRKERMDKEAVQCADDANMIIDGLMSLGLFYRLSPEQTEAMQGPFE